jgi:hypothetical protein
VGDTLHPRARALNGRGDSVAADITWSALDTTLQVVNPVTGATLGHSSGTGRLVARTGTLRSTPIVIHVVAGLDSIVAGGPTRDTVLVSAPDSLSDSLLIHAFGPSGTTANVEVALSIDFPPGAPGLTLVPGDTVKTDPSTGIAVFQVRLTGVRPDSAVVTATVRRHGGTLVAKSPITFVVEFH